MLETVYQKFREHPAYQRIATGLSAAALSLSLAGCSPRMPAEIPVENRYIHGEPVKFFDYRDMYYKFEDRNEIKYKNRFSSDPPPSFGRRRRYLYLIGNKSRNFKIADGRLSLNSNGILAIIPSHDGQFSNYTVEFDYTPLSVDAKTDLRKLIVKIYMSTENDYNMARSYDLYIYPNGMALFYYPGDSYSFVLDNRLIADTVTFKSGEELKEIYFKPWLEAGRTYRVSFLREGEILLASIMNNGRKITINALDRRYFWGRGFVSVITPTGNSAYIDNLIIHKRKWELGNIEWNEESGLERIAFLRAFENLLNDKMTTASQKKEIIQCMINTSVNDDIFIYKTFSLDCIPKHLDKLPFRIDKHDLKEASRALPVKVEKNILPLHHFIERAHYDSEVWTNLEVNSFKEWLRLYSGFYTLEEFMRINHIRN